MKSAIVSPESINRCPAKILLASHFHADGVCKCKRDYRDNKVDFYASDEEKKFLHEGAKKEGLSISAYIRLLIRRAVP